MLCPNCKSETKPGAKFCHVCGYPLPEESFQDQQTLGTENEKTSAMIVSTSENKTASTIDLSKITKDEWIYIATAGVGALGCLLPWARVSFMLPRVSFMWFAKGMNAWQGAVAFILFIGLIVFVLLKDVLKLKPTEEKQVKTIVNIIVPAVIILFTLISFIDILSTQYVQPSIGIFLSLISAILLLLMGLGIVKFFKK